MLSFSFSLSSPSALREAKTRRLLFLSLICFSLDYGVGGDYIEKGFIFSIPWHEFLV
jgi:hypothetical protein